MSGGANGRKQRACARCKADLTAKKTAKGWRLPPFFEVVISTHKRAQKLLTFCPGCFGPSEVTVAVDEVLENKGTNPEEW